MNEPLNVETTICPMCSSDKCMEAYSFSPFGVKKCLECAFHYLSPRLTSEEILSHYRNDDYFEGESSGYQSYSDQEQALRITFRKLLKNLNDANLCGGKLLEIGSGYGYLLDEAKDYFDVRVGTDFSKRAVSKATQYADKVYCGGVECIPKGETFDCIIATHVIEHVYDPSSFTLELKNRLNNNGKLVFATPDMGSYWRKIMGKRWPSFIFPEHVQYFDNKSLKQLLNNCGISKVESLPYPHAFPLPLVAAKLHITLPAMLGKCNLWISGTTVAVYGTKDGI